MDWSEIGKSIVSYAPLLSGVLAATGVGAPAAAAVSAAGALIASALGVPNTPNDVSQALLTNPDAAIKIKQIEADHGDHLAQIAQQTEATELGSQVSQLQTINETMQVEDKTRDFSWRDFWGYISGVAFAVVVGIVCYMVIMAIYNNHPELLATIPTIVGAFSVLFGIAATVLGVHSSIEAYHTGMADRGK
jgi:hypothetical protein